MISSSGSRFTPLAHQKDWMRLSVKNGAEIEVMAGRKNDEPPGDPGFQWRVLNFTT
jgi:hypothetical protein